MVGKSVLVRYVFLAAITIICLSFTQFSYDKLQQDDYYHIRLSTMMRQNGIYREFPWMKHSILNERFYDLHFLYHILLIPFTFGDLLITGKIATIIFAAAAVILLYWFLNTYRIKFPLFWSLLFLLGSKSFLLRMLALRPISLSVIFLIVLTYLLFQEKYPWIAVLGYLFVLSYSAFPVMLIITLVYALTYCIYHRKLEYRPVLYCIIGIVAGILISPYFPHNLRALYVQDIKLLLFKTGVERSLQVLPLDSWKLLTSTWGIFVILFVVILLSLKRKKEQQFPVLYLFIQCAVFLLLYLKFAQGMDFFIPFAILLSAFLFTGSGISFSGYRKIIGAVFLTAALAFNISMAVKSLKIIEKTDNSGSALWLKENTPQGCEVFLTNYGAFPELFFYNQHNVYTFGLSGVFMQEYDEQLYRLYLDAIYLKKDPYPIIKEEFDVRFIHVENITKSIGFYKYLKSVPNRYRMMYQDNFSAIFEVR